jgi:hypothetical protein
MNGELTSQADWVEPEYRQQGLNNAVVYGGFGAALIVVGAVLDAYL